MLPFLGTGTVLIPWAVFKLLSGDIRYAVGLVILYLVTQLVRRIIEPKLVGDSIGMNPLATNRYTYRPGGRSAGHDPGCAYRRHCFEFLQSRHF